MCYLCGGDTEKALDSVCVFIYNIIRYIKSDFVLKKC